MCCPRTLARARPSAVRVRIRSRSTSASPPSTGEQVEGRAGEPVDPRHRHHVAGGEGLQHFQKFAPVGPRARHLLAENLRHPALRSCSSWLSSVWPTVLTRAQPRRRFCGLLGQSECPKVLTFASMDRSKTTGFVRATRQPETYASCSRVEPKLKLPCPRSPSLGVGFSLGLGETMKRRQFIATSAAALALPSLARSEKSAVLKFVPLSDLSSVDPIWSFSYTTRSHGFMVFDTLYGQAGAEQGFAAKPQMVAGHTIENDGTTWKLVLRDGLVFHDDAKVLARDCVASIRRWGARDLFGQTLMQRIDELTAPDDRTIVFRLNKPFAMLPDALGKFGYNMCAIMPEHVAATDPFKQITEVTGSGPFRFQADERMPGSFYVYERFNRYKPRDDGQADFISGPKLVHFDRVEWHINPDPASVTGALQVGEIDWMEYAYDDLRPMLRRNTRIAMQKVGSTGYFGAMRLNHLLPPFDNPAIRRALMGAIDQQDFMHAVIGLDPADWHVPTGFFPVSSPMATDAGLAALMGPRDLAKVARDLQRAGYQGEKVVLLAPADAWGIKAICDVAADMLRKVGMNVDEQVTDGPTIGQRMLSKKPSDEGGWNAFCFGLQGTDALTPATHRNLRSNGQTVGWPTSPKIEALRDRWLDTSDVTMQRALAAEIQEQAFIDVPYFPLGTWYPQTAFRSDLTGVLDGQAIFWNVRRQG